MVYSMGTKATRRKAAVHYAVHSLSRRNLKNLMPRSSTFVCQLYFCSSKPNNNKALRITFNSCNTMSTSSMALARVNMDKIIKVTSASSYVYARHRSAIDSNFHWSSSRCQFNKSAFLTVASMSCIPLCGIVPLFQLTVIGVIVRCSYWQIGLVLTTVVMC